MRYFLFFLLCTLLLPMPEMAMAQCPVGETEIELTITAQAFADEISWKLFDANGSIIASTTAGDYPTDSIVYGPTYLPQHKFCLEDTAHFDFDTYDTFGDGWNGSTYELRRACSGDLVANNGGVSPSNGYNMPPPDLESSETFSPGFCEARDLALINVTGDERICAGDYYVDLTVGNLGLNPIDTAVLFAVLGGDTIDTMVISSLSTMATYTVSVGPFQFNGNSPGTIYPVTAWLEVAGDGNLANDNFNSFSMTVFQNSSLLQSIDHQPPLVSSNAGIKSSFLFCRPSITTMDSCFRIALVEVENLSFFFPTPLGIKLISPMGTELTLVSPSSGNLTAFSHVKFTDTTSNQLITVPSVQSGIYHPAEAVGFSKFYGENPNGLWELYVYEPVYSMIPIKLSEWQLRFEQGRSPNLGADTAVCTSNLSFVLNAGNGYSSYTWSTGSVNRAITVSQIGTYEVTTTDHYGCVRTDDRVVTAVDTVLDVTFLDDLNQPLQNVAIELIEWDSGQHVRSYSPLGVTNAQGRLQVAVSKPLFWLLGIPNQLQYPDLFPTYFGNNLFFQEDDSLQSNATCDTIWAPITGLAKSKPLGTGIISGVLRECDSSGAGNVVVNEMLYLMDSFSNPIEWDRTNSAGIFEFNDLAMGEYKLWVDRPSINNQLPPSITLDQNQPFLQYVPLCLYSDRLQILGDTGGLGVAVPRSPDQIAVFPNPANETVTIRYNGSDFSHKQITLTNSLGELVLTRSLKGDNQNILEIGHLPAGMYVLSVAGASGVWRQPLIVH